MNTAYSLLILPTLALPAVATARDDTVRDSRWPAWLEIGGDLRLRYETVEVAGSGDAERGRVRARLDLAARAADGVRLVFRVGTNDGSPVSDNLTLGDGFSNDDIGVIRAYLDWNVNDIVTFRAGRMAMPWYRAGGDGLLWDSDLDPAGVAISFDANRYFGTLAAFSADRPGEDAMLVSGQAGIRAQAADGELTAGLGYHDYSKTAGRAPFYDGRPRGNSVDANGNLVNDYSLVELFAAYSTSLGALPVGVFGTWLRNTSADTGDTAFALGVNLGNARAPGDVEVSYGWHDTGTDAVVGTFNDSDFAGGDTNASGHYLQGSVLVMERLELGATVIDAKRGERDTDYDRVMLDVAWSFD